MIKRGVIQLNGADPKIRISQPGIDVEAAQPYELLLHEQHLYAQPYFFKFVACPFAGNTSTGVKDQTVNVTVPNINADPIILVWPVDMDDAVSYPLQRSTGTGSSASGFAVDSSDVRVQMVNSTTLAVEFIEGSNSKRPLNGAYIILLRKT